MTLTYWMMLYKAMNLNTQKEVINAARPSLGRGERHCCVQQEMAPAVQEANG